MNKLVSMLAAVLSATSGMAVVDFGDSVHGLGTGDWMNAGNWLEPSGNGADWVIPGWVVGNPANTSGSTDWNASKQGERG